MTRLHLLLILLVLSVGQLYWLISVWRKHGFLAALKLFLYGALASAIVELLDLLELMRQ